MSKQSQTHQIRRTGAIRLSNGRQLSLEKPLVMGTLNVTPDSFSDGGRYVTRKQAVARALEMEGEGADIIDVGGESTRPGAAPVDADEEQRRVLPVIEGIRQASKVPISIDTYKSATARAALAAGADIVNDISGLRFDDHMAGVVAASGAPVVIMHMQGTPRDMQANPVYTDCVEEVAAFFGERIAYAEAQGVERSAIIIDPGIGFGKRLADNLEILARLSRFREFGLPILIGASRKRFIDMVHPSSKGAYERLGGSIAATVAAVLNGADIVRVHDVEQTVEAIEVALAVRGAR